ncbi:MAG: hypothetical protein QM778_38985 [Myxococcales bacterium]
MLRVFFVCTLLSLTSPVHASEPEPAPESPSKAPQERTLSLEVASGVVVMGEGPSALEGGLALDLGLAWAPLKYFVGRVAVGYGAMVDRHSLNSFGRLRAEVAARAPFDGLVPLLGVGASLWNQCPSVFGVFGLAVQFARTWQLGVDVRYGPFWDFYLGKYHQLTPFGEGQFRMSWAFR